MQPYQEEFVDFCFQQGALKFGEFTLKSGRNSPYFFNTGCFTTGKTLQKLGEFYANAIENSKVYDNLLRTIHASVYY